MGIPRLSKHRLICETIKTDILDGTYPVGAKIPPETELTRRFHASRMTVNRAIKELELAGYVKRKRGSGTYVLSRQVAEPRLLAIMIPCLPDAGIYHRLIRSIEETAFSLGYSIVLCNADFSYNKARSYVKELVSHRVSGILFSPIYTQDSTKKCMRENRKLARLFIENRIPFLCIDSILEDFEPQSYVIPDNEAAAEELMTLALLRGHKKCLLLYTILNSSARLRIKGARLAMRKKGLSHSRLRIEHLSYFLTLPTRRLKRMIKNGTSLIYAMDDLIALQVMNRLNDVGIRVPEDASLISHDDLEFAEGLGLTTVHQDLEKEGEEAVLAMHRLLKGELTSIRQLLPSRVILRKSLAPAPLNLPPTATPTPEPKGEP